MHTPELPRMLGRYEICAELGRGGMAVVYRVLDPLSGEFLAAKQLLAHADPLIFAESCARFEREFRTLSGLSHPRIIEVFDYTLDANGPFYTMELLDGGDLLELSPLPWQRACALFYDVCSSLALLHSRRMVHCDISPRNVRCTKDGRAKLFDFGAMVPMGRGMPIVGTPSFTAPEVVARSDLDGRVDLFSLGATLYYALTGRVAFAARDFASVVDAWAVKPRPPSHFTPGVPEALDRLTLSLLSLEASERPRNAFEVMQRLAALAEIERSDTLGVSNAYLSAPVMVGRAPLMAAIEKEFEQAWNGDGRSLLVRGAAGLGRSRVLDAAVIAAKLRGATVVRGSADAARGQDFAVALTLTEQLLEITPAAAVAAANAESVQELLFVAHPEKSGQLQLLDLTRVRLERATLQDALIRWLLALSKLQPIAIAVDDIHRIDEPSAALLAQCAAQSGGRCLILLLTWESDTDANRSTALEVLARQSHTFQLAPLSDPETVELLTSVFGDVPHVGVVGHAIHALAAGSPRLCLELARHLVDSGKVRYDDGNWTLPTSLSAADLPESAETALRDRVSALSALARQLLEAQALASHEAFTREDYALLTLNVSTEQVEQALSELLTQQFLVSDGRLFWLTHRSWASTLVAHMSEAQQRERHAALAVLYADSIKSVFHWFAAGQLERGLDLLFVQFRALGESIDIYGTLHISGWELGRLFQRALAAAYALQRRPRDIYELQRWLAGFAVASEDAYYWQVADIWRERMRQDSGLAIWEELTDVTDPGARLTQALTRAFERYTHTPEEQRVCRPDEAIRHLAHFVAISIAISFRTYDTPLVASLPGLLEPFAPLSPALSAIYQNAYASRQARAWLQPELARERWLQVYESLSKLTETELPYVGIIRRAIAAGVGVMEAHLGLESTQSWAELVEDDHMQAVQACYLRKVVCLQQGDWDAADGFRRRAEHLSLQSRVRPMFNSTLLIELAVHARAGDLTGVKQLEDRIALLAVNGPYWPTGKLLASGLYKRLCGQLEDACHDFEACLRSSEPNDDDPTRVVPFWLPAVAGHLETLIDLGRHEHARALGAQVLERCRQREIVAAAFDVQRAMALAEAKCGAFAEAAARLQTVIDAQKQLGVTGLTIGAMYEARARIAIWAHDEEGLIEYGALTSCEYRRRPGSALGACYERLMDEARLAFPHRLAAFAKLDLSVVGSSRTEQISPTRVVSQVLRQATTPEERATFALSLLIEDCAALGGYLYLVTTQGLALAAMQGFSEALPELHQLALRTIEQELEDMDLETVVADTQRLDSRLQLHETARGTARPIALTYPQHGVLQCVGVAVLVLGGKTDFARTDVRLPGAIATQLSEAGDAHACTRDELTG